MAPRKRPAIDRVLEKLVPDGDCMVHVKPGTKYKNVIDNGKHKTAHRVVYEHYNGPVPEGHVVRHTCDNPPCCKLEHLVTGTQQQNVADMVERGRSLQGQRNHQAKLSAEQVKAIRLLSNDGETRRKDIATRFGISAPHVSRIKLGTLWRCVA